MNAAWPFVAARALGGFMDLGFWAWDDVTIGKLLEERNRVRERGR